MDNIRIVRSFVSSDSIAELVKTHYDLPGPIVCQQFSKMLRTQDNDHYLVRAGDEKYVARIYQLGGYLGRHESDYLYELDWLNFLKERGIRVSSPIKRQDGGYLGSINAPEGRRYYALFSFAEGRPMTLDSEELLFQFGATMAEIHLASNEYESPYSRQPMDMKFLLKEPVAQIQDYWREDEEQAEELDFLLAMADEVEVRMQVLFDNEERTQDGWGPIGGDFHTANVRVDDKGNLNFFNFDLCGPGWRSYDIASFLLNTNLIHKSESKTEAFFAGYYSKRPLSGNEHASIEPFLTIRRIWLTSTFTLNEGLVGYTFIGPAR